MWGLYLLDPPRVWEAPKTLNPSETEVLLREFGGAGHLSQDLQSYRPARVVASQVSNLWDPQNAASWSRV